MPAKKPAKAAAKAPAKPPAPRVPRTPTPARQLKSFQDKFTPEMAALNRAAHRRMQQLLPGAFLMVYDNYNFFVIGYGRTERPSEALFSLAMNAHGLALCFLRGTQLKDPKRVLRGTGNLVRSVKLASAKDIDAPAVRDLMTQALALDEWQPRKGAKCTLVIRSVSAKQQPRRAPARKRAAPKPKAPAAG